jgi:succinylglutamate desuccinylase
MEPGFVNFQPVDRGQLLARDGRGEIRAGESGRILMPLYQSQGRDGFFLVREVSPRWLRVSALARRARLERLLPLLPGIHRDPTHADTLIVDRAVARWRALDLLHILGYRRRRDAAGQIVVTRRHGDAASRRE